jgi:hypothetical protein
MNLGKRKRSAAAPPTETQLGEAYYKRYGVYFTRNIIKKLTGQVTLSLRDMYSAFRGKEKNNNR